MAKLHFLGAAGTVTGSKFVVEAGGSRLMIDCGLFQGLKELRMRNWDPLPLTAKSINFVVLTHAHIDHTGYLPRLIRDGFDGPVYATKATADLLQLMLPDSARIQEEDAEYANRKRYSKHAPALPLYTERDARAALRQVTGFDYNEEVSLGRKFHIRFLQAGHILGSSFVEVNVTHNEREPFTILFSGDIGRYNEPILNDPTAVPEADYLLVESTYGDRLHDHANPKDQLAEIINATAERDGKIIIPAFAVGRTQLLIYYIRELENEGRIPVLPVLVDSPMGVSATKIYSRHTEEHDLDMLTLQQENENPLATRQFKLIQNVNLSKSINNLKGAAIIISASGMATGGRVLHHLAQHLPHEQNTVVLVGYQAVGTRGRRLQNGEKEIKIHGEWIPVRARVESIGSLSAHADASEILRWLGEFKRPPRKTFVVHGEPESSAALRERIVRELGWNVEIPAYLDVASLGEV
ncbi:MAG: MBL fold metallo-hydrolase [Blastocatellia bacterium]|nr:MBL fold metallo-hydrolase [Blastocatellia bacterium]